MYEPLLTVNNTHEKKLFRCVHDLWQKRHYGQDMYINTTSNTELFVWRQTIKIILLWSKSFSQVFIWKYLKSTVSKCIFNIRKLACKFQWFHVFINTGNSNIFVVLDLWQLLAHNANNQQRLAFQSCIPACLDL